LTDRQITLIRESLKAIGESSHPLGLLFYGHLFELDPSLRSMFKSDLLSQSKKLTDTLSAIADSLGDPARVRPILHNLGRRHVDYQVRPEHYPVVSEALLWALRQVLQQDFDTETRQAWTAALQLINEEMLRGAKGWEEGSRER
jgi:hemoglobin-like flavoprotein